MRVGRVTVAVAAAFLLVGCTRSGPTDAGEPSGTGPRSVTATATATDGADVEPEPGPVTGTGAPVSPDLAGGVPAAATELCAHPTVTVADATELGRALAAAGPGTVIGLADGVYEGNFVVTASGTTQSPAALCGGPGAVLDGGGTHSGYVLHLDGAQHWMLVGFTVRNGQKGVMADGTVGSVIAGLSVHGIGDEAVHLRRNSTDNLVVANTISDTGNRKPKFGEGVYVGTANSNWCDVTNCVPDASDRNQVVGNSISGTTAESVDIKEGTVDGLVQGNQFDATGMTASDSWVDVKGNNWQIIANVGVGAPKDGFQTHEVVDGWGTGNVFAENSGSLVDPAGELVSLNPAESNVVRCSNVLTGTVGSVNEDGCTS